MENKEYDFLKGEVLLVDKPLGMSSFAVVKIIRACIQKKIGQKLKVGHAGTLDPLATGLMILCTGKKTKEINSFLTSSKVYTGTIKVGATTPSYDLESEIDNTYPIDHITEQNLIDIEKSFLGEQQQTPPIFSAKKINGKRAYELARKGKEVKLKSNTIEIKELRLTSKELPNLKFEVHCSKGTYIRSLAYDVGRHLKSGAHLTELRRTASGEFKVENSKSIDEWKEIILKENPIQ